jgi:hypothetical protein
MISFSFLKFFREGRERNLITFMFGSTEGEERYFNHKYVWFTRVMEGLYK